MKLVSKYSTLREGMQGTDKKLFLRFCLARQKIVY